MHNLLFQQIYDKNILKTPCRKDVYKREYGTMIHAVSGKLVCTATADIVQTQDCAFVGELL